jgi:hypothetical protein
LVFFSLELPLLGCRPRRCPRHRGRVPQGEEAVLSPGDLRHGLDQDEGDCRGQARTRGHQGRCYVSFLFERLDAFQNGTADSIPVIVRDLQRPRLLQRLSASRYQGRWCHRRSRGSAYHQRAHRRCHRLRSRHPVQGGEDRSHFRSRWWYLRCLASFHPGRCLCRQGHRW